MTKSLVAEDDPAQAELLRIGLNKQGYTDITWIIGARRAPDGGLLGMIHGGRLEPLLLSDFQLAFVDGNLAGPMSGWDIVPLLVAANVICIGISTNRDANELMEEVGARASYDKLKITGGLRRKEVLVDDLLKLPPRNAA